MINRKRSLFFACIFFVGILTFIPLRANAAENSSVNINYQRIFGQTRYETSIEISKFGWKNGSNYAVIATGEDYPDSLCAAPLAAKLNAPVILVNNNSTIISNVLSELRRLNVKSIYIVGGTGVVSTSVEQKLRTITSDVTRLAGANRFETSAKIASQLGESDRVFLVTGDNYPDAISVAPIASKDQAPILLTDGGSLTKEDTSYISSNNVKESYVIGGPKLINDTILSGVPNPVRIFGADRYETNIKIAAYFNDEYNFKTVYAATGKNFPDALTGGVLASSTDSPILLVDNNMGQSTMSFVKSNLFQINSMVLFGSQAIISDQTVNFTGISQTPNADKFLNISTYDGSGQGCHPKVLYFKDGWNNWKYWMSFTPYPNGNDHYENPSIMVSNNGIDWTVPEGLKNPIIPAPDPNTGHYSDPELVYNSNTNQLELWYRFTAPNVTDTIYRLVSTDGVNWENQGAVLSFPQGAECLSPSIIYENNEYKLWYVNESLKGMYIESQNLKDWSQPQEVNFNLPDGYDPWHIDVVHTDTGYEALISTFKHGMSSLNNRTLMYSSSTDGINYNSAVTAIGPSSDVQAWDNRQIYRSTFVKVGNIYKVFYSAMDNSFRWHIGLSQGFDLSKLYGFDGF